MLGSFLNISGAFDNVSWKTLKEDLKSIGCSKNSIMVTFSYLTDRIATYQIGNTNHTVKLTRGCPQGSKYGPKLWSITCNPVLTVVRPEHVKVIAYADDLAILVANNSRKDAIKETEKTLCDLITWAETRGLSFSTNKSTMVTLKGGLVSGFTTSFGPNQRIVSKNSVKYLGIWIGTDLTYDEHIDEVVNKG